MGAEERVSDGGDQESTHITTDILFYVRARYKKAVKGIKGETGLGKVERRKVA